MMLIETLFNKQTFNEIFSLCDTTILKRLLIIFGSIACLWLILGLFFVFNQICRRWKIKYLRRTSSAYQNDVFIKEDDEDTESRSSHFTWISRFSSGTKSNLSHCDKNSTAISMNEMKKSDSVTILQTFDHLSISTKLSSISTSNIQLNSCQRTNSTCCSSKLSVLPLLMITDCDRLQTEIIDLTDFQPEQRSS